MEKRYRNKISIIIIIIKCGGLAGQPSCVANYHVTGIHCLTCDWYLLFNNSPNSWYIMVYIIM